MEIYTGIVKWIMIFCFAGMVFTGCASKQESTAVYGQMPVTPLPAVSSEPPVTEDTTASEPPIVKTETPLPEESPDTADPLFTCRTAPVMDKAEAVTPTAGNFSVSRAFSDDMILQRDDYIRIWGERTRRGRQYDMR